MSRKTLDPRIARTRERLGDALIALVQEKPFESIRVQDVLDRAGVGRSTFYAHYSDKDDLFLSDMDDFLGSMATQLERSGEMPGRVAPVRELFAHVAQSRSLYAALVSSGRIHDFDALARGHFARAIERRLDAPAPGLAQALAGALLSLLSWWMERGNPGSPEEMDTLFHRLLPAPNSATGAGHLG